MIRTPMKEVDAMKLALYLRDNKRLFTRQELLKHLGIKLNPTRWNRAIKTATNGGFIYRFGLFNNVRYCHADYAKELKAAYDTCAAEDKAQKKQKLEVAKKQIEEPDSVVFKRDDIPSAKFVRSDADKRPDDSFFRWFKIEPKVAA